MTARAPVHINPVAIITKNQTLAGADSRAAMKKEEKKKKHAAGAHAHTARAASHDRCNLLLSSRLALIGSAPPAMDSDTIIPRPGKLE